MNLGELAGAAALGLTLGAVTGMPLGVVNVAIVDAATRGHARFALGLGLGGALADAIHAAIAFIGVGRVVTEHPGWSKAMAITAATLIASHAVVSWLRRTHVAAPPRGAGFVTGLVLTLPNPAALAAWVAVAAVVWPAITLGPALVVALGVGLGSALWFAALARWIAKLPADHRVTRVLPAIAFVVLVGVAATGMVRAFAG